LEEACSTHDGGANKMQNFGRKLEGNTLLKICGLRPRLEDNIKMNFKVAGFQGENWVRLTQDRVHCWAVLNMVMKLGVQ
jgi:hypothetical protein